MNPYEPPSSTTPIAGVSPVAIGILAVGTIGLEIIAALLCGICCYRDIAGENNDDFMAIFLLFGGTLSMLTCIGIPAGMIHLRRKSKLNQIPRAVYIVSLTALLGATLLGNPLDRWFSIFLIFCLASIVASIRTAVRYQRGIGG